MNRRILVIIEGGDVQDVLASEEVEVILVDHDEGCMPDEPIRESSWPATIMTDAELDKFLDKIDIEIAEEKRKVEELLRKQRETTWNKDEVQFLRLLAEIKAAGLTPTQMIGLATSMALTKEQINSLLDRADEEFGRVKARVAGEGS